MSGDFDAWFHSVSGFQPRPWQARVAGHPQCEDRLLRVPTGFGKTAGVAGAWLWHRVVQEDLTWPTRLVWTLPMRTLVEQTEQALRALLTRADLLWTGAEPRAGRVGVHVLMGGSDAGDWHLWPEHPAVLIGTQDMLLSRALNRGYGAARARWPTEFGLVSHDALWVLDEVQLMDVGLATAAQLGAFRLEHGGPRPARTWAMSATLQRDWLEKSPDTHAWAAGLRTEDLGDGDKTGALWAHTRKAIHRRPAAPPAELARDVLARHTSLDEAAPLTLVVCNTVDRARDLHAALLAARPADGPDLHLLHSRFRGAERDTWLATLLGAQKPVRSRIVVATQVIEAGVDLSAAFLATELCPWPSLVQRLGRLARRGGEGEAWVFDLDRDRQAAPYDADALGAAWDALALVDDASPRGLAAFEASAAPDLLTSLYPYDPAHLVLSQEVRELFDTTPDLSGADLDISRYIRSGDERDVSVCWVDADRDARGKVFPPPTDRRPPRAALCAVPFLAARDWLCGKGSKDYPPQKLRDGVHAWVWDYLDGTWRTVRRADLLPGQVVLVDRSAGGYHDERGFDASLSASQARIPPVALQEASLQEQADASQDHEDLSQAAWQTIAFHGAEVARHAARVASTLKLDGPSARVLDIASRWHDLGKAHPVFQGAIVGSARPNRTDLAKAPSEAWRRGREMFREPASGEHRRGFRHELVSTLGLFGVLERHAPASHPSRLGELTAIVPDARPPSSTSPPTALEEEILGLSAEDFDLVAYLVCCHHGRLRARLHASPADQDIPDRQGDIPLRGVRTGDHLPGTSLTDARGHVELLPEAELHLDLATLGLSPRSGRSWTERVEALLDRLGPFTLAWLEALVRAADVRASRDARLVDPAVGAPVAPSETP